METFNYLRPIYYLITLLLIFNLLYLIILNKKLKIHIYVFLNSIILTVIGLVLLFQQGIIIDEFNMSGDSIIFYLSIFFIIITIISSLFTFNKSKHSDKLMTSRFRRMCPMKDKKMVSGIMMTFVKWLLNYTNQVNQSEI